MSGGHFEYIDGRMANAAIHLEELINNNENSLLNEWGDTIGRFYPPEIIAAFKNAQYLLEAAAIYMREIDLLVCSDTGEETFARGLLEGLQTQITAWMEKDSKFMTQRMKEIKAFTDELN